MRTGILLGLVGLCVLGVMPAGVATVEKSCHIRRFETPVRCVTVDVPRDYDAPKGATLKVTAVIVPATTARPAPDPLIMLAGLAQLRRSREITRSS